MKLRIVLISDTHNRQKHLPPIPDGDILIHAGDFTMQGAIGEIGRFNDWMGTLPHKHKIVIAGNHERTLDPEMPNYNPAFKHFLTNVTYLEHSSVVVEGIRIFGSPYSPEFMAWAFSNKSPGQAENRWKEIPEDTDIIVVHGPPHGFGDVTMIGNKNVGCRELFKRVLQIRPKLVVSGHIHEGYGFRHFDGITFANASSLDSLYMPGHEPLVYEWEDEG